MIVGSTKIYHLKISVKVKWGKETYDEVDLNTEEEPMVFKAQLFALTGVQVRTYVRPLCTKLISSF